MPEHHGCGLGAGFAYLAIESGKRQQALGEEQRTLAHGPKPLAKEQKSIALLQEALDV